MAPLKFEENIKDRIEERTIAPSETSWDVLAAELDKQSIPRSSICKWVGVAASIAAVIVVYFTTVVKMPSDIPQLVVTSSQDQTVTTVCNTEVYHPVISQDVVEATTKETLDKEVKTIVQSVQIATESIVVTELESKEVSETPVIGQSNQEQELTHTIVDETIIANAVAVVFTEVAALEKKQEVTAEEIDALLYEAQQKLTQQQLLSATSMTPSALLEEVETALDESFKERVFEALKIGFQKLKTSVAEKGQ